MKLVETERSVSNATLGMQKVKYKFQIPQAESFEEAVTISGGEPAVLEILNSYFTNRAPASALVALGAAKTQEEFNAELEKQLKNVREWRPNVSTGPSKADVFKGVTNLETFRKEHPQIWDQLSLDEGFAVITKERTLEEVLQSKGIAFPAAA